MGYELKYKLEMKGRATGADKGLAGATLKNLVFEIHELDPANNTVISLTAKKDSPPTISQNANKGNVDFQIISTQATLTFISKSTANLETFYTEDERKFKGIYKVDGNVVFKGWIFIDFSDEFINSNNSTVILKFSDGMGTLDSQLYLDENGNKLFGNATIISILKNINRVIGLDMEMVSGSVLKSNTVNQALRPFDAFKINQNRFVGRSCKEVLEILCTTYFSHFYQREGMFWFVPFDRNRQLSKTLNKYSAIGAFIENITISTIKEVGVDILMGKDSCKLELTPAYKSTQISTFVPKTDLFDNGYLEVYAVGASSPLGTTFQGVGVQENNVTFPGWTIEGTFKITCITYSQEYMNGLNSLWNSLDGNSQYGQFPPNNKVFVLDRLSSTAGAKLTSSKYFIRKGTVLNFATAVGHSLKTSGLQAENLKYRLILTTKEGIKYFLGQDSKWSLAIKRIKVVRGNYKTYIDSNTDPYEQDSALTGLNSSATQNVIISLNLQSQPVPVDGNLEIQMVSSIDGTFPNEMIPFYQFQAPIVTIISQPKGIEKVTYETTIEGKNTVHDTEYLVPICDNSLELIPCSVFDQDNNETQRYTNSPVFLPSDLLIIPLYTKALQFSRYKKKITIGIAYTHNIKICDLVKFNATDFPQWNGVEFIVTDINNYDIQKAVMSITMFEIVENGKVSMQSFYIDQNGFRQVIKSQTLDLGTPYVPTLQAPWTWLNVGNITGSAYHPEPSDLANMIVEGTGTDIWGTADNFGFLYRNGGVVSLEGNLSFPSQGETGTISPYAKVGIMYRESLDANSRHFSIIKRYDGYLFISVRDATGGSTNILINQRGASLTRFKIANLGNGVIVGYYHNGTEFIELERSQMTFANTAKIGFCFAMVDQKVITNVGNAIYSVDSSVGVVKPANLTSQVIVTKSAATGAVIQPVVKPTNLVSQTIITKSEGTGVITEGGGVVVVPPNTNIPSNSWGGARTSADRGLIKDYRLPSAQVQLSSNNTILNTNIDINVTMLRNGLLHDNNWNNLKGHAYKKWKNVGDFEDTPLQNVAIPNEFTGKQINISVYYFNTLGVIQEQYQEFIQL